MSRVFCIPGIVFLFCAFVLSLLSSISLPYLTGLDIARVHFREAGASTAQSGSDFVNQVRFGNWAHCDYQDNGARTCTDAHHSYITTIRSARAGSSVIIGSSWTRGLAVHPVATAVTFIALLLSFSTHVTVTLISSLMSFLAAALTLIAFAIDIALFVYVRHQTNKLESLSAYTKTGPGFWLTFVSLILTLLAGCTVCFGRRRDRMSGSTTAYPSKSRRFWSRNRV